MRPARPAGSALVIPQERIELRFPEPPVATRSVSSGSVPYLLPPTALIVRRPDFSESPLTAAFTDKGWKVASCGGPALATCPLMRGGECDLRDNCQVAVVVVDTRAGDVVGGTLPRIRCAADSSSPAIIAVEHHLDGARIDETTRTARIGGLRPPSQIVELAEELIERFGWSRGRS